MSGPTLPPMPGRGVVVNGPGPGDWLARYETVTAVVLLALPLALLAVRLLARRRRRAGWPRAWARRASLADVGLLLGTVPWLWLTLMPAGDGGRGAVSLVPLRDLATMPPYQVVGNLAVLAALGALGPVRFAAVASLPRITLLAATCSVAIESAQHLLRLDRVSSVDDVLLNTIGAVVAAALSSPWWRDGSEKSSGEVSQAGADRCLRVDKRIDA